MGRKGAEAFQQKAVKQLELLKSFPEMGNLEKPDKAIRGFKLTKQIRIYRIKGEKLIILNFFDMRQDPEKRFQ